MMESNSVIDEDDIWNYKGASRPKKGTKRRSKEMEEEGKNTSSVIDVDLEDDFAFTKLKSLNNEKSTTQWASIFSKKKKNNVIGSDIPKDKTNLRQKKNGKSVSKSPLKKLDDTKQPKKLISSGIGKNVSSSPKSKSISNYFSPSKNSTTQSQVCSNEPGNFRQKCVRADIFSVKQPNERNNENVCVSGDDVLIQDGVHPTSLSEGTEPKVVDVIIIDNSVGGVDDNHTTNCLSGTGSDDFDCGGLVVSNLVRKEKVSDLNDHISTSHTTPQTESYGCVEGGFIDCDINLPTSISKTSIQTSQSQSPFMSRTNAGELSNIESSGGFLKDSDEVSTSLLENRIASNSCHNLNVESAFCLPSCSTNSETCLEEVYDIESAGGFFMEGSQSSSSSQPEENSQENPYFSHESSTSIPKSNKYESSSNMSEPDICNVNIPTSTAARKQMSLLSFFPSFYKNIKPKKVDESSNLPFKNSLTKSKTFPTSKITTATFNQEKCKPKQSNDTSEKTSYGYRQRECPFYKKIPGTNITVDAFRYGVIPGCNVYFLTHFHYDHYGGLTKKFAQPIYCSSITGNLVEKRLGVGNHWINRLPMWKPIQVDGVTLTLMEANHCPGAVIVLFETPNGKKILHTGDFRATVDMEEYRALKGIQVDDLYLDTTYCNPSYAFPAQKTVIDFAVTLVKKQMKLNPNTLIVCGSYTIGKERVFTAIAEVLNSKICVMSDKKRVLDCLEDRYLQNKITINWSEAQVHVLPMAKLKQQFLFDHLSKHSKFTSILAFEPTGWTHSNSCISLDTLRPKWSKNGVTLYGIPYSEHSSFLELKRFVQFLRPRKILPTVNNGNAALRAKMEDIFRQWMNQ